MILLSAPRRPPNSLLRVLRVISGSTLASFQEWGEEQNTNLSIKHNLFSRQFCLRGHTRNTEETVIVVIIGILVPSFKHGESSKGKVKGGFMATNSLNNKKQKNNNNSCFSKSRLNLLHKKTPHFEYCIIP